MVLNSEDIDKLSLSNYIIYIGGDWSLVWPLGRNCDLHRRSREIWRGKKRASRFDENKLTKEKLTITNVEATD